MKNKKKRELRILTVIALVVLLFAFTFPGNDWVAPASADKIENPVKGDEGAIKEGKILFKQMCSICHGDKGKGDGIAGAALTPKPTNFTTEKMQGQTDGAIYWKMTEGRAPMAAYKDILKEEQRWQLVNYIRTLKKIGTMKLKGITTVVLALVLSNVFAQDDNKPSKTQFMIRGYGHSGLDYKKVEAGGEEETENTFVGTAFAPIFLFKHSDRIMFEAELEFALKITNLKWV